MFTLSLVELFAECGFTVNTQFSIENLKEKSLIAQRLWLFICCKTKLSFLQNIRYLQKKMLLCGKKIFYRKKYK